MKILLSGGFKTENILTGISSQFEKSGEEFVVEPFLDDIDSLYMRGEYFDKLLITEQSITKDFTINDETEVRHRVNDFAVKQKERGGKVIFLTQYKKIAVIISEETYDIRSSSIIILKQPKYSVNFFVELIRKDIQQMPADWVYKDEAVDYSAQSAIENEESNQNTDDVEFVDAESNEETDVSNTDFEFVDESQEDSIEKDEFDAFDTDFDIEQDDFNIDATNGANEIGVFNTENVNEANDIDEFNFEDLDESDFDNDEFQGQQEEYNRANELEDDMDFSDTDFTDVDGTSTDFSDTDFSDTDFSDESFNANEVKADEFNSTEYSFEDTNEKLGNHSENNKGVNLKKEEPEYDNFDFVEDTGNNIDITENNNTNQGIKGVNLTKSTQNENNATSMNFDASNYEFSEDSQTVGNNNIEFTDTQYNDNNAYNNYNESIEFVEEEQPKSNIGNNNRVNYSEFDSTEYNKQSSLPFQNTEYRNPNIPPFVGQNQNIDMRQFTVQLQNELRPFANRGNSIMFTGCGGCGTSVIAYNIAKLCSLLGYKTLLVDLDTEHRAQSYISKDNYISMNTDSANLMAAFNSGASIASNASIPNTCLHLLTMGIGGDTAPVEDTIQKDKISRFVNLAKSQYNFIIYDTSFKDTTTYLQDITYNADNLALVVDSSNWGMTKTMLSVCNIQSEEMESTIFNKAQIVFNRYKNINHYMGKKVKDMRGILDITDKKVFELVGEDIGLYFSEMNIAGIINEDPNFEMGWFEKVQYCDTPQGQILFGNLLRNIVLNK